MAGPRRSTRTRTTSVKASRETLTAGYHSFAAGETDVTTGGGTDTAAVLTIGGVAYGGSSKSDCHAEMDALNSILVGNGDSIDDVLAHTGKTVTCTSKPVCYRCAIVLGLFGFVSAGATTLKTRKGMGQTQWVLPSPLSDKVKERWGDLPAYLTNYSNITKI
jgi:hypothetical protein